MPRGWRIDELARESGITVDTIRYYQREGLLPPARRAGRVKLYRTEHLERLERIRELQRRRFSLAAIRALLDAERPGLIEGVFGAEAAEYSFDDLVQRSGVDRTLAGRLREARLLRDPGEFGRDAYDREDLDMLHAVAELTDAGLPDDVVVEAAAIFAEGVEAIQAQMLDLFTGRRAVDWDPGELADLQARTAAVAADIVPLTGRILGYVYRRTLQRLTLGAIEAGRFPPAQP